MRTSSKSAVSWFITNFVESGPSQTTNSYPPVFVFFTQPHNIPHLVPILYSKLRVACETALLNRILVIPAISQPHPTLLQFNSTYKLIGCVAWVWILFGVCQIQSTEIQNGIIHWILGQETRVEGGEWQPTAANNTTQPPRYGKFMTDTTQKRKYRYVIE